MAARPRRLTRGILSPAISAALAVLLVATVVGVLAQRATDRHDRSIEATRDASQVVRLENALAARLAVTREVALEAAHGNFVTAATSVVRDGTTTAVALTHGHTVDRIITRTQAPPAVTALVDAPTTVAARDSVIADGDALAAAPVSLAGTPAIVFVAPGYGDATPNDVAARRAADAAIVVVVVPWDTMRSPAGVPPIWPEAKVRITTAQGVFGPLVPHPVLATDVQVAGAVWHVAVGRSRDSRPIIGFVIFLTGLLAAALVYLGIRRQWRERSRVLDEVDVRSRQLQLIATTSATLQQSLDLAALLPTFAVDISDEFDLACVSIVLCDDAGGMLEIFRHGRAPSAPLEVSLDLRRGWRTVGQLVVHPRRRLDQISMQSLQAVADLLAIAVTNSQLYEREQQAVSRLSELDALKNAFLSTVSHELRTATTAIQGFADLLTEHWGTMPDERRLDMASRIRRQSGSLRHLVDDLLDYARLDSERLRVSPRDADLSEIVQHLTESLVPLVASHRLVVDIEPALHAWVDPIAVERIVANLLSNAGKYAPAGTTVTVTVGRAGDRVRLSVADQGTGIPEAERRRVFVRFYRLDNAETIRTHGAGIGLAILHDFAERSGATVSIEDAPGGGTLIHVDFPTAPAPAMTAEAT